MKIRRATKSDKEEVLRFCVDTFEWGDYIHQVWDFWYEDQDGLLLVAEEEEEYSLQNKKQSSVIAVSHVSLCPNKSNVWLEGIRVNPNYRRRSVATQLLNKMIAYGQENGAREASAMVTSNNFASQLMMERNGFTIISKWNYYTIDKTPKRVDKVRTRSKVAALKDTEMICDYLKQSEIYKSSGQRYVSSWRWYSLDLSSNTLADLVKNEKVLVIGNDPIEGVAIINKENKNNNNNIFQIVYLDSSNAFLVEDLIRFAINLIHSEDVLYDRIEVYSPQTTYLSKVMEQAGTERPEQFLLYKREIYINSQQ
ncbi:MAG TPA: GNAT family N-acetyltransferase [Nitrososphaeraceae archaeon]|nr:GNAT family N-acetyltransferase [Nitrososphaeraceae archaeon]